MKKRILSILLAAALIICSLPMAFVTATAANSEIVLTNTNFPETVTNTKLANNYPTQAGTFSESAVKTWDPGVSTDGSEYASLYSTGGDVATFTYSEGWATLKTSAENTDGIGTELTFKSTNSIDANYISVRLDATKISTKKYARIQLSNSSGDLYSNIAGATYYFLPDANEENPEPVIEQRTMTGDVGSSKWDTRMIIEPGDKGTLYLPETFFASGELTTSDFDFSSYMTESWRLSHSNRKANSLRFVFTSAGDFSADEEISFGEMNWICNAPFSLSYNALYTLEDFSDAETVTSTAWGKPFTYDTNNMSVANGVWQHTIDAETWTEDSTFGYYPSLTLANGLTEGFEALCYDVDLSALENSTPYFQITYGVKDTNTDMHAFKRRYIVSNGDIYAVWENGAVETLTLNDNKWLWFKLPDNFKGTIVIPTETFKDCENSNSIYPATDYNSSGATDLFKNDDVNNFSIEIAMNNVTYSDKGKVIEFDNFGYLTTLAPEGEGMSFTDTKVQTTSKIAEDIDTFEAWVKLDTTSAGGTIIADKYHTADSSSVAGVKMYVTAEGKPALYLCDGNDNAVTIEGSSDIRTGKWTHIAFVKDTADYTLKCYVNGGFSSETTLAETMGDVIPYHTLTVGHLSLQSGGGFNTTYFSGSIQEVRLWSDVRTSSEIVSGISGGITGTEDGLIANWSLNGESAYVNIQGNTNYNLKNYISEITAESDAESYAALSAMPQDGYTMVVLPDTQISNAHYPENFTKIYDWIINNEEALNIKIVMGLGDIVDTGAAGDNRTAEWERARTQFARLTEAEIPWSVILGNHDVQGASVGPNLSTDFNTYFPISELSKNSWFGGAMIETESDNVFYKITVGTTKYIIICLDLEPTDAQVEWANQVCANNPDCKIIVTTHEYMNDGATYLTTGYTNRNTGKQLWDKLVSKHENIIMAFGGHVAAPDIQVKEDIGVNGNKVINALIDGQALDYSGHSMVALLKFSADGSEVKLNYYSVTGDCFMDLDSQMTLSVGGTVTDEPLADAVKTDFTVSKFYNVNELRNFKYFANEDAYLGTWSNTSVTIDNTAFSWDNQKLKLTAPSTFEGEATKANIPVYFKQLPNVTSTDINAYSFWIDCSNRTKTTYAKLMYYYKNAEGKTDVGQPGNGDIVYLVYDNGTVESKLCTGTWSSVDIPAGFVGSIVVPFTSMKSGYGSGEQLSNATFLTETEGNSMSLQITILEANPSDVFCFNNINYLDIYDAVDLAAARNQLLGDANGKIIYVNNDDIFNALDIVRLKKVLAQ